MYWEESQNKLGENSVVERQKTWVTFETETSATDGRKRNSAKLLSRKDCPTELETHLYVHIHWNSVVRTVYLDWSVHVHAIDVTRLMTYRTVFNSSVYQCGNGHCARRQKKKKKSECILFECQNTTRPTSLGHKDCKLLNFKTTLLEYIRRILIWHNIYQGTSNMRRALSIEILELWALKS